MTNKIFEEVQKGDFSNFNRLNEKQQVEIMKNWNSVQWIKYRMQNTVSEEDVFNPILKLIESND